MRYVLVFIAVVALTIGSLGAYARPSLPLVKRIIREDLTEFGELRAHEHYADSEKSVVVLGEVHIGESQLAELEFVRYLIVQQGLEHIYIEGTDVRHTIRIGKDLYQFVMEESRKSLVQETLKGMVQSNEIGAVEYIQLMHPEVKITGVTDRAFFEVFHKKQKNHLKRVSDYMEKYRDRFEVYGQFQEFLVETEGRMFDRHKALAKQLEEEGVFSLLLNKVISEESLLSNREYHRLERLSYQVEKNPMDAYKLFDFLLELGEKYGWLTSVNKDMVREFQILNNVVSINNEGGDTILMILVNRLKLVREIPGFLDASEQKTAEEFITFSKELMPIWSEYEQLLEKTKQFSSSEALEERDRLMIDNLIALMKQNEVQEAVLIVGAAHQHNIISFLKDKKINCALVALRHTCLQWKSPTECLVYDDQRIGTDEADILNRKLDKSSDYISDLAQWLGYRTKPRVYLEEHWFGKELMFRTKLLYIFQQLGLGRKEKEVRKGLDENFSDTVVSHDTFEHFRRCEESLYVKVKDRNEELLLFSEGKVLFVPIRKKEEEYTFTISPEGIFFKIAKVDMTRSPSEKQKIVLSLVEEVENVPDLEIYIDDEEMAKGLSHAISQKTKSGGRKIAFVKDIEEILLAKSVEPFLREKEGSPDRKIRDQVREKSRPNAHFFYVSAYSKEPNEKVKLTLAGQDAEVGQDELNRLLNNEGDLPTFDRLFFTPASDIPKKIIVYRNNFFNDKASEGELMYYQNLHQVDPLRLLVALRRRYKESCHFYLDDKMDRARYNLSHLPKVKRAEDIAVYFPEKSQFKVKDYRLMRTLEKNLTSCGIHVERGLQPSVSSNILVISGHKDEKNFQRYVENLGEAGALREKLVVLFSCYASGEENFNSRLIEEDGSRAILFYSEEINADAVKEVLLKLSDLLRTKEDISDNLVDLLNKSVDRALEANPPDNKKMEIFREEIEKMRQGVLQISFFIRPQWPSLNRIS